MAYKLYFYGDSHSYFGFKNFNKLPHEHKHQFAITMFRIGRDNTIVNHSQEYEGNNSIFCLSYGEIDCRCHIQRQVDLGHDCDTIIDNLIKKYFESIQNNIKICKKIIIVAIIPPMSQCLYESIHGKITHEFPFVGNDEIRIKYTKQANAVIEQYCKKNNYIFFNPYEFYTNVDGCLKYELSDKCVHLGNTDYFIECFNTMLDEICNN
jgi:hypothetical protein